MRRANTKKNSARNPINLPPSPPPSFLINHKKSNKIANQKIRKYYFEK